MDTVSTKLRLRRAVPGMFVRVDDPFGMKWTSLTELAQILDTDPLTIIRNHIILSRTENYIDVLNGVTGVVRRVTREATVAELGLDQAECFVPGGWATKIVDAYQVNIDLSKPVVISIGTMHLNMGAVDYAGSREVIERYTGSSYTNRYRARIKWFVKNNDCGDFQSRQQSLPSRPLGHNLVIIREGEPREIDKGRITNIRPWNG